MEMRNQKFEVEMEDYEIIQLYEFWDYVEKEVIPDIEKEDLHGLYEEDEDGKLELDVYEFILRLEDGHLSDIISEFRSEKYENSL